MSKQVLLALANANLFVNKSEKVKFFTAKEQSQVADYSAFDPEKGYDIKGINVAKGDLKYIRLTIILGDGENRAYFGGALFPNTKKGDNEKAADFTGSINLTRDKGGEKLRLAAWNKKGEKAGDYLSLAISQFQEKTEQAEATATAEAAGADDDIPF